jgi:type VI secretion system protein VasJ
VSDLAAVAALGTTPIAGANPSGVSARYEPEFEKLAAEIAKMESPEGRAGIKWDIVADCGIELLTGKTKDLLVASYTTLGLLHMDGYAGLAAGFTATRDLLKTFWDTLFPEKARLRARGQALQWMNDRITPSLTELGGAAKDDKAALESAVAVLAEIVEIAGANFQEGGPTFGELTSAVQDKLYSIPADEPPPSAEPAATDAGAAAEPAAEAPPPPPAQREIDSPDAAREVLNEMKERRVKAATVLREANAADPMAYGLLRAALWENLTEAPPATDGVTQLAGGDAAFAAAIEDRLDKGDYAGVLPECEAKLAADPTWLDVNFFAHRAMEGLGKPYAAARRALAAAVVGLVRAVPALLDVKYADGTPMAGQATKLWILHELSALPSAAPAGGLESAMAEARKLVARKSFPEAAALLQKELRSAVNRRDRFLGRLYLAKLCAEAGRSDLALPQLEGLDEEGRKFALEEWEPSLAAEIARELWRCHKASATPERAAEFYGRLCRLDLGAALAADGKK